nr:hypothetical protein [uncultured Kingella sp.]
MNFVDAVSQRSAIVRIQTHANFPNRIAPFTKYREQKRQPETASTQFSGCLHSLIQQHFQLISHPTL